MLVNRIQIACFLSLITMASSADVEIAEKRCLSGLSDWKNGQHIYRRPDIDQIVGTVAMCEQALTIKPDDKDITRQLCLGYFFAGRGAEAIPYCVVSRAEKPSLPETVLGAIYLKERGKHKEYQDRSVYWLRIAAESDAAWPMRLLGEALTKNEPDEAQLWFWRAYKKGDVDAFVKMMDVVSTDDQSVLLPDAMKEVFTLSDEYPDYIEKAAWQIIEKAYNHSPSLLVRLYDSHLDDLKELGERKQKPYLEALGWAVAFRVIDSGDHDTALARLDAMLPTLKVLSRRHIRDMPTLRDIEKKLGKNADRELLYRYGTILLEVYSSYPDNFRKRMRDICTLFGGHARHPNTPKLRQCPYN